MPAVHAITTAATTTRRRFSVVRQTWVVMLVNRPD